MIDLKNFMFIVENGKAQGKPAYQYLINNGYYDSNGRTGFYKGIHMMQNNFNDKIKFGIIYQNNTTYDYRKMYLISDSNNSYSYLAKSSTNIPGGWKPFYADYVTTAQGNYAFIPVFEV